METGIKIGYYKRGVGRHSTYPAGWVDLSALWSLKPQIGQMLWRLKDDAPSRYAEYKRNNLPAGTPHTGLCNGRFRRKDRAAAFYMHSGVMMLDYDAVPTLEMLDLSESDPHLIARCLSASGRGLHFFYAVTPKPTDEAEQKACYLAAQAYFSDRYGVKADTGFNGTVSDLCYYGYDPDPYAAINWHGFKWAGYKHDLTSIAIGGVRASLHTPNGLAAQGAVTFNRASKNAPGRLSQSGTGLEGVIDWRTADWRVEFKRYLNLTPDAPLSFSVERHRALLAFAAMLKRSGLTDHGLAIALTHAFADECIDRAPYHGEVERAVEWAIDAIDTDEHVGYGRLEIEGDFSPVSVRERPTYQRMVIEP